jgi:hypothetical protein
VSSQKKLIRKTTYNDETCLHMNAFQWVQKYHPELLIFHVANERKSSIGAAMHFKRMGVLPGVADFLIFRAGRAVAIELKDDEGDQTDTQLRFQKRWETAGHAYVLVRTLDEFKGAIDAITLLT